MGRCSRSLVIATLSMAAALAACRDDGRGSTARGSAATSLAGAHIIAQPDADPGSWPMATKDFANTRYVALDQIDARTVGSLHLAWSFPTGNAHGHEGAPIVAGDTIYVVTPFPNRLVALDLQGKQKWQVSVPSDPMAEGYACCDLVNHGAVLAEGRVYFATLDGIVVAVDAATGTIAWQHQIGDVRRGITVTGAPLVVAGKVLIGTSGALFGQRGRLYALDAATGDVAWQAYSTGPDADVRIGPAFQPYYALDHGDNAGQKTWAHEAWERGGGDVSGFLAYDATADVLYHGTGSPAPWNHEQRVGDNKFTSGVFARDPQTGEAMWFYQYTPHDMFGYDGTGETILLDLDDGKHVLVHPDANGYLYVLDRTTGQVLSADPYVPVTSSTGVDPESGQLAANHDKVPVTGVVTRDICPGAAGAKTWQPSAFSPQTGLVYIPHQTLCMNFEPTTAGYIEGTPYFGANVHMYRPGDTAGALTAWDPLARHAVWSIPDQFPVWSGALATAGGLVFYGTMSGEFRAVDARTGTLLWRTQLPSGVIGQPISFRGSDGKQYVAVYAGVGGWAGSIVTLGLDPKDQTAGRGFAYAMKELQNYPHGGGALYVFSL
jgi:PQQ-dependent dehydrogenase (methanol/ethanol family)